MDPILTPMGGIAGFYDGANWYAVLSLSLERPVLMLAKQVFQNDDLIEKYEKKIFHVKILLRASKILNRTG